MDEKYIIERSFKPVEMQMAVLAVLGIILLIFTTRIFTAFDDAIAADLSALTRLSRWFVLFAVAIGLLLTWFNGKKLTYYATKDSITIMRGAFGAKSKKVYGLEHVTGMGMDQSAFGAKMNYGQINIDLSMMSNIERIRLINVENPDEVLKKLQSLVKK